MSVGRGQRGRTTRSTRSRGRTPWRGTHRPRTDEPRPPRKPLGGLRRDALDIAHPLIVEADGMFDQDLRRLIPLLDAPEDEEDLVGVPHRGSQLVCAREDRRRDERADRAERRAAEIEERDLPLPPCLLLVLRGRHDRIQTRELMLARTEAVGRAAFDERLEDAFVAALKIDAPAEVVERAESSAILARLDDALDRTLPDVLDRAETE